MVIENMSIQDNLQKQMHCIPWAFLFVNVKYIVREIISTFIIYGVTNITYTRRCGIFIIKSIACQLFVSILCVILD